MTPSISAHRQLEELYRQNLAGRHLELDWAPIPMSEIFLPVWARPLEHSRQGEPPLLRNFLGGVSLDAGQISSRVSKAVILGPPGAGKTTLLEQSTRLCAQGQAERLGLPADTLPLFISLDDFALERARASGPYSLLDHLYYQTRQHVGLEIPPRFFQEALRAGRCLVCLDGLDKIWSVGVRGAACDQIEALASRYSGNRFLITSRSAGYDQAPLNPGLFPHYGLLPWGYEDVQRFVTRWYAALEAQSGDEQKIDDLLNAIQADPRLRDLFGTPLHLTLLALTHHPERELSRQKVVLCQKSMAVLLGPDPAQQRLLERLAYSMHAGTAGLSPRLTIKREELDPLLEELSREIEAAGPEAVIRPAQEGAGPFRPWGEGIFAFVHPTLQAYLVACDIHRRGTDGGEAALWAEIQDHLHDNHWREVILLLLGKLSHSPDLVSSLVRRILAIGEGDQLETLLHRHLFLVAHALVNRVQIETGLRQRIVDGLLDLVRRGSPWERGKGLELLAGLKGCRDVGAGLVALALDEGLSSQARSEALSALGTLRCTEKNVLDQLLGLIYDEDIEVEVRREATNALGQLSRFDEGVLARLLDLAYDDQANGWMRRDAAQALTRLGYTQDATTILLALAQNDQLEDLVRCVAISALGELGQVEQGVIDHLMALAQDDQLSTGIRSDAARALGQLGCCDPQVLDSLLALAQDENTDDLVRGDAIGALGQLGQASDQIVAGLLKLAQSPQMSTWVRSAAVGALGQLGYADEKVLNGLQSLIQDEQVDLWVRHIAEGAFKSLVGDNVV